MTYQMINDGKSIGMLMDLRGNINISEEELNLIQVMIDTCLTTLSVGIAHHHTISVTHFKDKVGKEPVEHYITLIQKILDGEVIGEADILKVKEIFKKVKTKTKVKEPEAWSRVKKGGSK